MRAVLTNFGTTGDIQPFLALAVELRRRGHDPVMAFSPYFASRVEELGFTFLPIGPDLREAQNSVNAAMMAQPDSVEQMMASLLPLVAALPQVFSELSESCRGADVLISGPAQPAGRMVHELTGIPFISVQLSHFGGVGTPALRQASAELINPFRAQLGLPPLSDPLTIDANSPQLALYAMSRHVRPPQADWPAHYHMTGFFFLDDEGWQPDAALTEFLAAGERPVVFTFGSMTHENPEELSDLILSAVRRTGCRAIVQKGWGDLAGLEDDANIYAAGYVPHSWLFPRAACIVHHGGGGTAGAVFRSGVPSVFVPHGHIFDQHYWAALAQDLNCAGPAIPYSQLTADSLTAALRATLSNESYRERARDLSVKVRAEQGTQKACSLGEQLVRKIGLSIEPDNSPRAVELSVAEREQKAQQRKQSWQQQARRRKKPQGVYPEISSEPVIEEKEINR